MTQTSTSRTYIQEVADCLDSHIEVSRVFLDTEFAGRDFRPGSHAAEAINGQSKYATGAVGPAPVREALGEILLGARAGLDHMSAIVAVLRSSEAVGFAAATLARGSIEAYGRSWFLASAGSVDELVVRWLRTRISSLAWLAYATKGEPEANKINEDLCKQLTNDAKSLGATEVGLKFSKLAIEVIDAAMPSGVGGQKTYSILSSVAHAERSGINMLMTHGASVGPGLHEVTLGITPQYLLECLIPLLSVHGRIAAAICNQFGATDDEKQTWLHHFGATFHAVVTRLRAQ